MALSSSGTAPLLSETGAGFSHDRPEILLSM
jgi:hypothetical protein